MTKKTKIISSVLSVLLALSVLLFLLAPKPKPGLPTTTLITPSASATIPYPTFISPENRPHLNITWQVTAANFPAELPYYQSTLPLLSKAYIQALAARLGFSDADQKKDTLATTLLYIKGSKSLFASTLDRQLTYTDTAIPKIVSSWPTSALLVQSSLQKMTTLFNNPDLDLKTQPEIIFLKNNGTELVPSPSSKAPLVQIIFNQTLEGFPYLTTSATASLANAVFDAKNNLYYLEIHGGVNNHLPVAIKPLINFNTLKQLAAAQAEQISSPANIELANAIATSSFLDLTVREVQIGYFNEPKSDLILPVILLKGSVSASNIPETPLTFMVPAFTANNYQ